MSGEGVELAPSHTDSCAVTRWGRLEPCTCGPTVAVPEASGYDWLLNKCADLDQAAHAGHLDEGERVPSCFHCADGAGR